MKCYTIIYIQVNKPKVLNAKNFSRLWALIRAYSEHSLFEAPERKETNIKETHQH